jgi:hypothetical protein
VEGAPSYPTADGNAAASESNLDHHAELGDRFPKLVVSEPEFDFGMLERGGTVRHYFVLRNAGTALLHIHQVSSQREDCQLELSNDTIESGTEAILSVTMDLSRREGSIEHSVRISSDDVIEPQRILRVVGTATSRARFHPKRLDLGTVAVDEQASAAVELDLWAGLEFAVKSVYTSHREWNARIIELEERKRFQIVVSLSHPLTAGNHHGIVQIFTSHPGEYQELQFPVACRVVEAKPHESAPAGAECPE